MYNSLCNSNMEINPKWSMLSNLNRDSPCNNSKCSTDNLNR